MRFATTAARRQSKRQCPRLFERWPFFVFSDRNFYPSVTCPFRDSRHVCRQKQELRQQRFKIQTRPSQSWGLFQPISTSNDVVEERLSARSTTTRTDPA